MNIDSGAIPWYCCGCGFVIDQTNPRCQIVARDDYMGTYGPCCARLKTKERKRWEKNRNRARKRGQNADTEGV